ncbi:hypothetical protein HB364_32075 [Pseudoflavitalea sp. X16]|uniref:BatA domain-containing protein n=1 Tax=Paraflavitalea devenefica TaxID=2716334 RepID=UPI00141DA128|nr:BatA domain-containing protein [Paraflavitalea devenefica]NII29760.1 hypothetical protein [Paraflavitalea devenefica]
MLQLLYPIALLAGAAVMIPVLVHLWHVRKGKTRRVGSIALLTTPSRQRARNLRITNWPLFLLRCLLLLLLALLLAKPVWITERSQSKQAGWILIPQAQLKTAYAQYRPQIDSLLAAGLELHNFSTGFKQLQLKDSIQPIGIMDGCLPGDTYEAVVSRWSLLKVLDANLPPSFPLHVFINNRLSPYHGDRPVTHLNLYWHSFSQGDSIIESPVLSYVTTDGKIKNIARVTTPQGNYYQEEKAGALFTTTPDTSIIRVAIYAGKNTADARYVKAAIQAIGTFTGKRIDITTPANGQFPSAPQNLIVRLEEYPDTTLLSYTTPEGILFQYDTGAVVSTTSWLQQGASIAGEGRRPTIYRYVTGPVQGTPVWTLANGIPILTVEEQEGKRMYHYKSRFNPAWGDLVWEDGFVKTWLPLVIQLPANDVQGDLRKIDDRMVVPVDTAIGSRQSAISNPQSSIASLVWMMAFIVLSIERLLTYRQAQRMQDA